MASSAYVRRAYEAAYNPDNSHRSVEKAERALYDALRERRSTKPPQGGGKKK